MKFYVGNKIKNLRKERKLLQKDLCGELINKSTMCKIENDIITPSIEQLFHISNVLKIPISYFFEEDNLPPTADNYNSSLDKLFNDKQYFDIIDRFFELKNPNFQDYFYIGLSYFNIEEYNECSKFLKEALKAYNKLKNNFKKINAENYSIILNTLAKIKIKQNLYIKATHYLHKATVTLESNKLQHTQIYIIVVSNLGSVYCYLEQYNKSITICENFLKNNLYCTYMRYISSIHLSLNLAYFKINKIEMAIDHIKKAIFFYEYTGNKTIAGRCYTNYINCLRYNKQFDKALEIIDKNYLAYGENVKNIMFMQKLIIYYNLKLYDKLSEELKHVNINNLKNISIIDYYFLLGRTFFVKCDYKKSHYYYNKCIPSLVKYKRYVDLSIVYKDLGIILLSEEFLLKSDEYLLLYKNTVSHSLYTNVTVI